MSSSLEIAFKQGWRGSLAANLTSSSVSIENFGGMRGDNKKEQQIEKTKNKNEFKWKERKKERNLILPIATVLNRFTVDEPSTLTISAITSMKIIKKKKKITTKNI